MNNGACLISKQRMLLPSSHYRYPRYWAQREFRMETHWLPCLLPSPQFLQPPPKDAPWRDSGWESTGYFWAPDSWSAYQRSEFSEPGLLHPLHRKTLNFWTWDIWFSLINSNLLKFQLLIPGLCCKNSYLSQLFLLQWKGKRRNEFSSFPFLGTKNIKRTVSMPEHSQLFTLTAPNSECVQLSLLFCPLTLRKLHLVPIFLRLC